MEPKSCSFAATTACIAASAWRIRSTRSGAPRAYDSHVASLRLEELRARLERTLPTEADRWQPALGELLKYHRRRQTRSTVQDERHRYDALERGKAVEVQARCLAIPPMHIANTDRQGVHTSLRDKVSSLGRISKQGFVFRHGQTVLCARQTTEFGLDCGLLPVRQEHHRAREDDVFLVGEM